MSCCCYTLQQVSCGHVSTHCWGSRKRSTPAVAKAVVRVGSRIVPCALQRHTHVEERRAKHSGPCCFLLFAMLFTAYPSLAGPGYRQIDEDTANNIPSQLTSEGRQEPGLGKLMNGAKGREIQGCTRKCMPACIRGGEGAPGLGPITLRKELVIFKEGFRDRKYCLTECTTVCALSFSGKPGTQQ